MKYTLVSLSSSSLSSLLAPTEVLKVHPTSARPVLGADLADKPWTRGCVYVSSVLPPGCQSCCVVRRTGACVYRCFLSLLKSMLVKPVAGKGSVMKGAAYLGWWLCRSQTSGMLLTLLLAHFLRSSSCRADQGAVPACREQRRYRVNPYRCSSPSRLRAGATEP